MLASSVLTNVVIILGKKASAVSTIEDMAHAGKRMRRRLTQSRLEKTWSGWR